MASDIVLNDNASADDFHIELLGSRVTIKHPNTTDGVITFVNHAGRKSLNLGDINANEAVIGVQDKHGEVRLSGHGIRTDNSIKSKSISCYEAHISELEIASKLQESVKPGKIILKGRNGKAIITLNGESGAIEFGNGTEPMIYIHESGTSNPDKSILSHSKNFNNWGLLYRDQGDKMIFQADGSPVLTADLGKKKVGVGTDNPAHTLHVEGEVAGRGAFKSLSDLRCKKNLQKIDNPLDVLQKLNGVSFNWNSNGFAGENPPEDRQYGFVAQEVEALLPELVSKDSIGRRSLAYSSIIPFLVEGLKTQQKRLRDIEKKLDHQINEQDRMTKKIERLEEVLQGASGNKNQANCA